jgi:hypothetical protein
MRGWAVHAARTRADIFVQNILVGKFEFRKPLREPRHWWEDNIGTCHKQIGYENVIYIQLAENRVQ